MKERKKKKKSVQTKRICSRVTYPHLSQFWAKLSEKKMVNRENHLKKRKEAFLNILTIF